MPGIPVRCYFAARIIKGIGEAGLRRSSQFQERYVGNRYKRVNAPLRDFDLVFTGARIYF